MICIFGFVGKLIGFAFKFSWSMIKVAFYLVFLPFILIAMVFGGLLYIAFPILVVAMIIGLLTKEAYEGDYR
jgi:hypothetical protein